MSKRSLKGAKDKRLSGRYVSYPAKIYESQAKEESPKKNDDTYIEIEKELQQIESFIVKDIEDFSKNFDSLTSLVEEIRKVESTTGIDVLTKYKNRLDKLESFDEVWGNIEYQAEEEIKNDITFLQDIFESSTTYLHQQAYNEIEKELSAITVKVNNEDEYYQRLSKVTSVLNKIQLIEGLTGVNTLSNYFNRLEEHMPEEEVFIQALAEYKERAKENYRSTSGNRIHPFLQKEILDYFINKIRHVDTKYEINMSNEFSHQLDNFKHHQKELQEWINQNKCEVEPRVANR